MREVIADSLQISRRPNRGKSIHDTGIEYHVMVHHASVGSTL
jgi:hypothetical protein